MTKILGVMKAQGKVNANMWNKFRELFGIISNSLTVQGDIFNFAHITVQSGKLQAPYQVLGKVTQNRTKYFLKIKSA